MTTKRVTKSDVTASVNPMSTLENEHQNIVVEHKKKMYLTCEG